jgi:hypothetical protein
LYAGLSLFLCLLLPSTESQRQIEKTSVQQVLSRPGAYDGKTIEVRGFLVQEFENSALYPDSNWHHEKGIWIIPTGQVVQLRTKLKNYYILLTGTFNANAHGHLGQFKGTLTAEKFELLQAGNEPK